jgi:hypothetical protein
MMSGNRPVAWLRWSLALFFSASSLCFAQPGHIDNAQYARVVGHAGLHGRHAPLKWGRLAGRINPATGSYSMSYVTVDRYADIVIPPGPGVAGQTIHYDFAQSYLTAIRLWAGENYLGNRDAARAANGVPYHAGADATVEFRLFPVEHQNCNLLGYADVERRPMCVLVNPTVIGRAVSETYAAARAAGVIGDISVAEYLDMTVRQTVIHEAGHTLGLLHTSEDLGHPSDGGPDAYFIEILPAPNTTDADPSIMTTVAGPQPVGGIYLSQLRQRLGRPVTLDDIRPSQRDLQGASLQWRGLTQRDVSDRVLRSMTRCVTAPNCTAHDEL